MPGNLANSADIFRKPYLRTHTHDYDGDVGKPTQRWAGLLEVKGLPETFFVLTGQVGTENSARGVCIAKLEDLVCKAFQVLWRNCNIGGRSDVILVLAAAVSPCTIPTSATAVVAIAARVTVGRRHCAGVNVRRPNARRRAIGSHVGGI